MSGGILALATKKPFRQPQAAPLTSAIRMPTIAAPAPSPMASMALAATTLENTSTDPTDRSMPEVMMTNVMPMPSTAQTETFCAISEKFETERKFDPPVIEKKAMITRRTPRIHTDWVLASRLIRLG